MNDTERMPVLYARICGLLYVIVIIAGGFAEFYARGSLIVRGDAMATAANIHHSEWLFRLGIAGDVVGCACYIAITAILYRLLAPVNRTVSLIAAYFSLAGCAVLAANLVNHIAPLLLLGDQSYLHVFAAGQREALALTAMRLHAQGYGLTMVFFGVYCFLIGCLVIRSRFIPWIVGVFLVMAGLWDVAGRFAIILAVPLPNLGLLGLLGEGSLALWLLFFGVNEARWRLSAGATSALAAA